MKDDVNASNLWNFKRTRNSDGNKDTTRDVPGTFAGKSKIGDVKEHS